MTDSSKPPGLSQFFAEMSRRHVGRFALGYLASAFVVLQLAEIVFPAFGVGEGGLRLLVVAAVLGFPPALVLAWMYDVGREGITRTEQEPTEPWLRALAMGSLLIVTILATGSAGLYLARQGVFEPDAVRAPRPSAAQPVAYDPAAPINSIAVLPITDNSPGGDQAYFAASMHEELIAKLSGIESIRVPSRTSTMRYAGSDLGMPDIARELGVDVVIEGSVVRTPERTRVTLQLIHGPSDSHIRTFQWDRERIDDVLAFQTEIAHEVVEEVLAQHDEESFTTLASNVTPEAQDAYFRGRFEYDRGTPEGYQAALRYFEQALAEDPDFAQAMAGMAGARFLDALQGSQVSEQALIRAHDEAEAALALDSTSTEVREVFALIERSLPRFVESAPVHPAPPEAAHSIRVFRLPGMDDSLEIDVEAFDTAWVAPLTTLGGRIDAQIRQRTFTQGDRTFGSWGDARPLLSTGRFEEAEAILERSVSSNPQSASSWDMLARSHVVRGDIAGAVDVARRWGSTAGTETDASTRAARALEAALIEDGERGYWGWKLGRLQQAEEAGEDMLSFEIASAHAALGNDDAALQYLIRALRAGEPGVMSIRTDPVWDSLRRDERLREILREAQRIRFSPDRRTRSGGRGG